MYKKAEARAIIAVKSYMKIPGLEFKMFLSTYIRNSISLFLN